MARVAKVAAGVAVRKGKAEKKVRTTNWCESLFNILIHLFIWLVFKL